MNCLQCIYLLILSLFLLILVAVFHICMLLSQARNEMLSSAPPQENISFVMDRATTFDRLVNFFGVYKSHSQHLDLSTFIKSSYHNIGNCEFVNIIDLNSSLLLKISGNSTDLKPYLIGIDLNVEIFNNLSQKYDRFKIDYIKEVITGFGSMSSKSIAMSLIEALNLYITNGMKPTRTFYILFLKDAHHVDQHNSEIVLEYFRSNNVKFSFILESPGVVLNDTLLGVNAPLAIIGITRKGYISMELHINQMNGPNVRKESFPLSSMISSLSATSENMFGYGVEISMLESLASVVSYPYKLIYTNLWFFKPFLSYLTTNDLYWQRVIRTKTRLRNYNFVRMTEVVAHVEQILNTNSNANLVKEDNYKFANKEKIDIKINDLYQPNNIVYDFQTKEFKAIKHSFQLAYPNSSAIPGDSYMHSYLRNFENISTLIYQFSPIIFGVDGLKRFETNMERLTLTHYLKIIKFYYNLFVLTNKM